MNFKTKISNFYLILILFSLGGCAAFSNKEKKNTILSKIKKRKSTCYYGLIAQPESTKRLCAIWRKKWNSDQRQPVLAYNTKEDCSLTECEKSFDLKKYGCTSLQEWKDITPAKESDINTPCYCDFIPIDNDKRGDEACAIWKPGEKFVKEYHFLTYCTFETCKNNPFIYSKGYCNNQFQKFFED